MGRSRLHWRHVDSRRTRTTDSTAPGGEVRQRYPDDPSGLFDCGICPARNFSRPRRLSVCFLSAFDSDFRLGVFTLGSVVGLQGVLPPVLALDNDSRRPSIHHSWFCPGSWSLWSDQHGPLHELELGVRSSVSADPFFDLARKAGDNAVQRRR